MEGRMDCILPGIVMELRWSRENVDMVKWAPWNKYKGAEDADGEVPEGVPVEERGEGEQERQRVIYVDTRSKVPREFYLTKRDVEKY